MTYYADNEFEKKMRKVVKRHNRMATTGVVHKMMPDGLVVAKPRIYAPRFPWMGLVLLVAAIFMFKGYVHYALGASDFAARAEALATGGLFEQLGGFAMQADPITVAVSSLFSAIFG